jgi:hypothetical protein
MSHTLDLAMAYSARSARLTKAVLDAVSVQPGRVNRMWLDRLYELGSRNDQKWKQVTKLLLQESRAMERKHRRWMRSQFSSVKTGAA